MIGTSMTVWLLLLPDCVAKSTLFRLASHEDASARRCAGRRDETSAAGYSYPCGARLSFCVALSAG